MWNYLRHLWNAPSEQDELVKDLKARIAHLEADYTEVAHALRAEVEARRTAGRVRDALLALDIQEDNIVSVDFRERGSAAKRLVSAAPKATAPYTKDQR